MSALKTIAVMLFAASLAGCTVTSTTTEYRGPAGEAFLAGQNSVQPQPILIPAAPAPYAISPYGQIIQPVPVAVIACRGRQAWRNAACQ